MTLRNILLSLAAADTIFSRMAQHLVQSRRKQGFLTRAAATFTDFYARICAPRAYALKVKMEEEAAEYRQMTFTFATVALSAKLAKADGALSREEFLAFREVFPLEDMESAKLRELFRMAWEDNAEAEVFARQVLSLYPKKPELWRELLKHLCAVALADGPMTTQELKLLSEVGAVFGYGRLQLGRLLAACADGKPADPFRVLGVARGSKLAAIRVRYIALMRLYHPDHAAARLSYPEARAVAARKSVAINDAYRVLMAS